MFLKFNSFDLLQLQKYAQNMFSIFFYAGYTTTFSIHKNENMIYYKQFVVNNL